MNSSTLSVRFGSLWKDILSQARGFCEIRLLPSKSKKTGFSPFFPIIRDVRRYFYAPPQRAEKAMTDWIYHNADMSAPYDQVPGVRLHHTAKLISSAVERARRGVPIRQTRFRIKSMNEMRTVETGDLHP